MSSRRWQQSWPRSSTTAPHGDRRRPGQGAGSARRTTRLRSEDAPPQGRILRHVVGHLPAPSLDVPVPQMVDQLPDIEHFFAALSPDPEQVIEVPKILPLDVPMRAALRVTQLVEQLVEVPTTVSYSSLFQRTVEQHVDIPASRGRGLRGGIEGFFPGQSSTAPLFSEQIVDIPVPRGDLQGFLPGQGSTASSSHSPDAANEAGVGVFSHFSPWEKSAASAAIPSPIVPASVSSWTRAACEDLDAADEPAEMEDAELLIEEEEDPSGWSVSQSASGRPYFWHRSSRRSVWHLPLGSSARKKKGRRKRKEEEEEASSSNLFFLLASSSSRQWHMQDWFCWFLSYAVSPSSGGRPKLPSFMDGMDKMDSFIARRHSRQWQAGLAGIVPRAVSLSLSSGPRCPASWLVWIRSTVMSVLGRFAGDNAPRTVFSSLFDKPIMLGIMAVTDKKDSYALFLVSGIACVNAPRAVFSSWFTSP